VRLYPRERGLNGNPASGLVLLAKDSIMKVFPPGIDNHYPGSSHTLWKSETLGLPHVPILLLDRSRVVKIHSSYAGGPAYGVSCADAPRSTKPPGSQTEQKHEVAIRLGDGLLSAACYSWGLNPATITARKVARSIHPEQFEGDFLHNCRSVRTIPEPMGFM